MNTIAYIACSMDGYIAKSNGAIDWLTSIPNPTNSDYGFEEYFKTVDAVLMGKNTFLSVDQMNYWPYTKMVYIWSSSLKVLDKKYKNRATIINGDIKSIISHLEEKNIKRLYVDGGRTIQSFLNENLLDEMIITTISIILGNGIPLFGRLETEIEYYLYKTERIDDYMVKNYYRRRNRTKASTL